MSFNTLRKIGILALTLAVSASFVACSKDASSEVVVDTSDSPKATPAAAAAPTADENGILPDGQADANEPTTGPLTHEADFKRYQQINSDVFGWISVPNTSIEYPVVVTTDNDYYLTHNVEKKPSKSGAIFMDTGNSNPANQHNIILYGHNMNNGSMFNTLNQYKEKNFFENNSIISFYNGDEKSEYEVFSAFNVDTDVSFNRVSFNSDKEFLDWANRMRTVSRYKPVKDFELTADDQILTLSTCTYEYDNQRFVVQARKVK